MLISLLGYASLLTLTKRIGFKKMVTRLNRINLVYKINYFTFAAYL